MSCEKPLVFLDRGKKVNGKRDLKFLGYVHDSLSVLRKEYGDDRIITAPCGKCPSCIKTYRMQWSLRCEAEAKCHKVSCFITLTYDKEHRPSSLVKDDLKKFIKTLRNRGLSIRYFGCGEYSPAGLPHYHIILFGYMPSDMVPISKSKSSFWLYKSRFIESIWAKGLCTVQEFDSAVAGYVAGYVDKKLHDRDSFIIMSNRPGIGHDYYIKNIMKLYDKDHYISKNGFIAPLPRYCDKVADQFFFDLSDVKEGRVKKSREMTLAGLNAHGFVNIEDLNYFNGLKERTKKKYARSL